MKFVVFGDQRKVGLLENGRILDLAQAAAAGSAGAEAQSSFSTLQGLIEAGSRGLDAVQTLSEKLRGSDQAGLWVDASKVKLQAPWPGQRFALAGSNNANHLAEAFTNLLGKPLTVQEAYDRGRKGVPSGFWGMARPIMGPDAEIQMPAGANGYFDFEAEAAIILGKQGKDIKAKEISDYVWGVTLVADWSIRVAESPPKPNPPFMPAKNFDCSKSIGPCIVVGEIDPDNLEIETYVNGKRRQHYNSKEMIFSFGEILQHVSRDFTFYPGDVVAGGTGAGTAIDQTKINPDGSWPLDLFLKPGDTVEMRAGGVGSFVSHIVEKK